MGSILGIRSRHNEGRSALVSTLHQKKRAIYTLLAIYQTVSLGYSVNRVDLAPSPLIATPSIGFEKN
jgi:hypothetical protein